MSGYPKTSGATGVQIYVPIELGWSYDQVRNFVGTLGRTIERADREHVTMAWQISKRTGKVFIDHNMNRSGANISAAILRSGLEARARLHSSPVEEVDAAITPQDFRIENVWERFEKLGDLFEGVRTQPQDLPGARGGRAACGEAFANPEVDPPHVEEVIAASKDPDLGEYLRKRTFGPEGTTEPAPSGTAGEGNSFVIHKHRATRLHYDVRLERDGALPSWAVPRGLPTKPGDKRLAVRTEDHPLEYGSFEGSIPEGHYGAEEQDLRRLRDEPVEWTDSGEPVPRPPGTGSRVPFRQDQDGLARLPRLQSAGAADRLPPAFQPMLAEGGWKAFDDPAWWFEPKFDGIRSMTTMGTDATRLVTRNGRDVSDKYPELRMIHELVDQVNAVLDAEIVAFDEDGKNSFEVLQQRMNLSNEREIKRISSRIPVALVAFDLLWLDGHDLTDLALEQRRELLETIVEQDHRLQVVTHVDGGGTAFAEVAEGLGLEGVVAKRTGSKYQPGRARPTGARSSSPTPRTA